MFGNHTVVLDVTYDNCTGGGSTTFDLVIECDSTNTPITLTNVAPDSEQLKLDLIAQETVVSSYLYSHAICGAPAFSAITNGGHQIDFVTHTFANDIVTLTAAPQLDYTLVGSYAIQVEISSPVVATLSNVFAFEVSDPCENVIYAATIELTELSTTSATFDFGGSDDYVELAFDYSHYICEADPTYTIEDENGNELTFVTGSMSQDTITFKIEPTLYSEVGTYDVTVKFTSPVVQDFVALFTIEVEDPCVTALTWEYTWTPTIPISPLSSYKAGDAAESYVLVVSDNVSDDIFNVPNTCGVLTLTSATVKDGSVTESDLFTVTGTDSQELTVTFESEWDLLSSSQDIIIVF